jgi:putative N6-adenine-specific DNA methylase
MQPRKPVGKEKPAPRPGAARVAPGRFPAVAQTLQGLEAVLAQELRQIGGNDIRIGKRAVYFTADKDLMYKANLRLRTALRILIPLRNFKARNEEELYWGIKAVKWPELFDVSKTFVVKASTSGPVHTHSQYAALRCKDAIADSFRESTGSRPSVSKDNADVVVHLRIFNDDVTVSLDSSGEPLHRRGYRHPDAQAPLNECLAAGMLLLAGYEGLHTLVDGMCGSGTLCIEAALMAQRISPGLLREGFSFMHWRDYDEELYGVIHQATVNRISERNVSIVGIEKDFRTVNMARESAQKAGMEELIDFRFRDFFHEPPPPAPGLLVLNPPYDERMKLRDADAFYAQIGSRLKEAYSGYNCWVISGHAEAMNALGLRTYDTHHLLNGMLPCRYSGYRMYSGSKRAVVGE